MFRWALLARDYPIFFSVIKNHGKRKELELFASRMPVERYQSFTLLAFILLVIEQLIRNSRRILNSIARKSFLFSAFLFVGFFKPKNIQLAEDAMKNGNPIIAGELYLKESEKSLQGGEEVDPKIMLNAGLCFTEGEDFIRAGEALDYALQLSIDSPNLQSKVLNALGNLQYEVTNQLLDQQNVNAARKTWEEALRHYNNASSIDGNLKAQTNLDSLNRQIQERIEAMVCKMVGLVWRDSNGNGRKDPSEPNLQAQIFWDKNDDGERNESIEPAIKTNENGEFAFEWISASYPTSLKLGSILFDQNRSDADEVLIPLYPPPPLHSVLHRLVIIMLIWLLQALSSFLCLGVQPRSSKERSGTIQIRTASSMTMKVGLDQLAYFWMIMEILNSMIMKHHSSPPRMVNLFRLFLPVSTPYVFSQTHLKPRLPGPKMSTKDI